MGDGGVENELERKKKGHFKSEENSKRGGSRKTEKGNHLA